MRTVFLIARSALLVSALSFAVAGCAPKNTDDQLRDYKKQIEAQPKETDAQTDVLENPEVGGQPGLLGISGVIVKNNSSLDDRISATAKGGIGKDGKRAETDQQSQPTLRSKVLDVDLTKQAQDSFLIGVGCNPALMARYAKARSLTVKPAPPAKERVLVLSAKTVILCGQAGEFNGKSVGLGQVSADELILDHVDIVHLGILGGFELNANALVLVGANKIATKTVNISQFGHLAPALILNVVKAISSKQNGTLALSAEGGSYIAPSK